MSPHLPLRVLPGILIAVLLASAVVEVPSAAAAVVSSLATVAIASTSNDTHIICALALNNDTGSGDKYALNCTTLKPGGPQETYPSGRAYYTGVAAGDGFLCGVSTHGIQNPSPTSVMRWWEFPRSHSASGDDRGRRVYRGAPISGLGSGGSHVCGLIEEKITCWRWTGLKQPLGGLFSAIAVGKDFVCGLQKGSGKVRCFGNDFSVVNREPREGSYAIIAASSNRACVVAKSARELWCWGSGVSGVKNKLKSEVAALALGERNRMCMIDVNGGASCRGEPGFSLPPKLEEEKFMSITANGEVFCGVLTANYSLVCWGSSRGFPEGILQRVVFGRVLPRPCQRSSSCPCGPLPGSEINNMCPDGTVLCNQQCDNDDNMTPPTSVPPPNQAPVNGGRGGGSDKKRPVYLAVGSVGAGIALIAVAAVLIIFARYGGNRARSQVHDSRQLDRDTESALQLENWRPRSSAPSPAVVKQYTFEFLHAITDGFSDRNKIGYGSFGSVYRAALPNGRQVAIKRADSPSSSPPTPPPPRAAAYAANYKESKEQAFDSEVELLSRVHHKNLVRLLGYCREGPELVLVYEYMDNGTLHDHLHRLTESPLVGSWESRLRIALNAARGIEYLHRYAVPPIIHRDIKPSNILLDAACTAKVSDFGLCCAAPECDECGVEEYSGGKRAAAADPESYSASAVPTAGTVGYMDPEYYRLQCLTAKSDVYSFGVVLLELLTGRRAIFHPGEDEEDTEPCNVVDFAVPDIEAGEVQRVLDRNLQPPRPCEIEAVQQVGELAAYCVQREGRNRPDMAYVVGELQQAVDACSMPPLLGRCLTAHSV